MAGWGRVGAATACLCGPGFPSSSPHAGHFKGAEGRGQPGQAGLGLLLPKPPPEVEKHLENVPNGIRFLESGAIGSLWLGVFLWQPCFIFFCLKLELTMAQLFKSVPFKSIIIIIIITTIISLV